MSCFIESLMFSGDTALAPNVLTTQINYFPDVCIVIEAVYRAAAPLFLYIRCRLPFLLIVSFAV